MERTLLTEGAILLFASHPNSQNGLLLYQELLSVPAVRQHTTTESM